MHKKRFPADLSSDTLDYSEVGNENSIGRILVFNSFQGLSMDEELTAVSQERERKEKVEDFNKRDGCEHLEGGRGW